MVLLYAHVCCQTLEAYMCIAVTATHARTQQTKNGETASLCILNDITDRITAVSALLGMCALVPNSTTLLQGCQKRNVMQHACAATVRTGTRYTIHVTSLLLLLYCYQLLLLYATVMMLSCNEMTTADF